MELHPILELPLTDPPAPRMWYVLSPGGGGPSLTVGHTCMYLPRAGGSGRVVLVGGANPSGPFADTFVLDLDTYTWEKPDWAGLTARYEHTCFTPESQPHKVFVFGGAEQGCNLNNVQVLDTGTGTWTTADVQGTPPSPRTCHYTAHRGDRLYVWGGGKTGAEPVEDRKLHVFDAATLTWSQPQLEGKPPKSRHGHVMVATGNKLYVHGGMSGVTFYDDLYVLNLDTKKWKRLKPKGPVPSARAAHTAVVHGSQVYLFGGMNQEGALDSMHVLNTENLTWRELKPEGPPPGPRLDHAACIIQLSVASGSQEHAGIGVVHDGKVTMLLVYGGMDTQGIIHDDCLVMRIA
ncbi:PREDICTED: rab9 effector protein with kelch motifs-like [Branchiostoma belcheri]|uniref:Rab9 effector protein with kelch motifs n=1 Tax=Branchiostoma belcheri TaxID=7741 RepID=A0A6P5AB25_BRABE|nr:PREDICTED: rab9 effector protein with kelch motifs-like [Branchiostoma belcheri]